MQLLIAIDGACRRNGQPTCVAAGGVFVQQVNESLNCVRAVAVAVHEAGNSTSQRGELLALLKALDYVWTAKMPASILTDSEYIFNAMTKQWYENWDRKGWVTAQDAPVKNRDLWEEILHMFRRCSREDIEIAFFYVKGHCIPFGKVTADGLLNRDESGAALHAQALTKYDLVRDSKAEALLHANDLSERNNGFRLSEETLRAFVAANLVADAIATKRVDAADKVYLGRS